MRGKEGIFFFSSCKPFRLCSGLRAESGSERREATRLREKKKEGEEKEEELGLRGTLFHSQYGVRSRRKKNGKEKSQGEGSLSWVCEGEDAACKAKLGLELGGLSGSLPSGYSPTTHRSALLACLLSWLVQDPAPTISFLFFFYLPPDALFHSSLTPLQDPACCLSTVSLLP